MTTPNDETPNESTVPSSEPAEDYAGDTADEVVGPDNSEVDGIEHPPPPISDC